MSEAKETLRGGVYFIAWLFGGLFIFYGLSGKISTQPFVRIILSNMGVSYFDFVGFWFWLIIIPITFWYYVVRPASRPRRGGFGH